MPRPRIAIKIGGSLFDLPELASRLKDFFSSLSPADLLLIPGGGITADVIRAFDRMHHLGEETSHHLALRALSLNAFFLQSLLPDFTVTAQIPSPHAKTIVDAFEFFRKDDDFPPRWEVTSDSLAVRIAFVAGAQELILLKSCPWDGNLEEAAKLGMVDAFFPEALRRCPLSVRWVCLRS